ncbi:MAG: exodeoxyribonuclease VII large subunit [Epsilonproteobacteria bacterium]|nr:exodeoxyribonuclease VII large subunit [Campylobacterota bacterium]
MRALSVTELNNQVKAILEPHFEIVYVKGEVSKAVYHSTGHLYFTIKDENSSISCAMWRSNLQKMKFKLKEGDEVIVYGALSLYVPRGEYKLIAKEITPSGVGELQLAYERLKEELEKLGYFDESRKKPLPRFPKRVALVTSATGAALADMLRIAKKRWLLSEFYLFDTLVQGEDAAEDIAKNIKKADTYRFEDGRGFDVIIVGRGGGSKEDLWAFNKKEVADAIFNAKTPVISAVGHEIDYMISDFVADKRAATPSNAMEILLPDKNEILLGIDKMVELFQERFSLVLQKKQKELNHLNELFFANSPKAKIDAAADEIEVLKKGFVNLANMVISKKEMSLSSIQKEIKLYSPQKKLHHLNEEILAIKSALKRECESVVLTKTRQLGHLKNAFETLNPKKRQKQGFGEIVKDNKRIGLSELEKGDIFFVQNADIKVKSEVLEKIKE